jgi:hypothetical protein
MKQRERGVGARDAALGGTPSTVWCSFACPGVVNHAGKAGEGGREGREIAGAEKKETSLGLILVRSSTDRTCSLVLFPRLFLLFCVVSSTAASETPWWRHRQSTRWKRSLGAVVHEKGGITGDSTARAFDAAAGIRRVSSASVWLFLEFCCLRFRQQMFFNEVPAAPVQFESHPPEKPHFGLEGSRGQAKRNAGSVTGTTRRTFGVSCFCE